MGRFTDDLHAIGDFPEWRPYTAFQLIGKLDIGGMPPGEQRAAVAGWLTTNDAAPELLASLQAERLIDPPHHSAA